jgi:hypothetical protein
VTKELGLMEPALADPGRTAEDTERANPVVTVSAENLREDRKKETI